jgi:hypothetical protein
VRYKCTLPCPCRAHDSDDYIIAPATERSFIIETTIEGLVEAHVNVGSVSSLVEMKDSPVLSAGVSLPRDRVFIRRA